MRHEWARSKWFLACFLCFSARDTKLYASSDIEVSLGNSSGRSGRAVIRMSKPCRWGCWSLWKARRPTSKRRGLPPEPHARLDNPPHRGDNENRPVVETALSLERRRGSQRRGLQPDQSRGGRLLGRPHRLDGRRKDRSRQALPPAEITEGSTILLALPYLLSAFQTRLLDIPGRGELPG
jgi:hypothetical protein